MAYKYNTHAEAGAGAGAQQEEVDVTHLSHSRSGYASHVSRKYSEFKMLIDNGNKEMARRKMSELFEAFQKFEFAHQALLPHLDLSKVKPYNDHHQDMKLLLVEAECEWQRIQPDESDNISSVSSPGTRISSNSISSTRSSVNSARLKAGAKKAALLAKSKVMEKQLQVQMELERLKLEAEIIALEAEEDALAQHCDLVSASALPDTTESERGHATYLDPNAPPFSPTSSHVNVSASSRELVSMYTPTSSHDYVSSRAAASSHDLVSSSVHVSSRDPVTSHISATSRDTVTSYISATSRDTVTAYKPAPSRDTVTSYKPTHSRDTVTSYIPAASHDPVTSYTPAGHRDPVSSYLPSTSREYNTSYTPTASREPVTPYPPIHDPVSRYLPTSSCDPISSYTVAPSYAPVSSYIPPTSREPVTHNIPVISRDPVTSHALSYSREPVSSQAHSGSHMQGSSYIPPSSRDQASSHVQSSYEYQQDKSYISNIVDAMRMPKTTLMSFNGDPMSYWIFMNQFDNAVHNTSVPDGTKLASLFEYCTGKAAKVIKPCALMQPGEGYSKARKLLQERFGNDYTISEAWIHKVTQGPALHQNSTEQLQDFADDLKGCVETLRAMGKLGEIDSRVRMVSIVKRLPYYLQSRWRKEAVDRKESRGTYPDVEDLMKFIDKVAREVNDPIFGNIHKETKDSRPKPKAKKQGASFGVKGAEVKDATTVVLHCILCNADHALDDCKQFKEMTVEKRVQLAKEKRLCFSCLKPGKHTIKTCRMKSPCGINGCKGIHSKMLHQSYFKPPSVQKHEDAKASNIDEQPQTDQEHGPKPLVGVQNINCYCGGKSKIALPALPVTVKGKHGDVHTFALLDPCSNKTFCSESLIDKLGIPGEECSLSLATLNGGNETSAQKVSLEVHGKPKGSKVHLPVVYSLKSFPSLLSSVATCEDAGKWQHLQDIDIPKVDNVSDVSLLIGQDVPHALAPLEMRHGEDFEPYAVRTRLGWIVSGPMDTSVQQEEVLCHLIDAIPRDPCSLEHQVQHFFKVEDIDDTDQQNMSLDDKRVIDVWDNSLSLVDGHYQLDIPFKSCPPELPNNRSVAERRLAQLGRRLRKDPDLHQKYKLGIDDLINKGFAEPVPDDGLNTDTDGMTWYLPHHNVVNPNKPNKVRIVFDCAAEYAGTSLNKRVLQGPDLTNSLLGVLLRFRENKIAIMGDIEGMFHQVKVSPPHRNVLRFLWWPEGDTTKEPEVYRMTVHLFGGVWSPSCASYALRRTALDQAERYDERVVSTVMNSFYVDDCLDSLDSTETATNLVAQLCELLSNGGFRLTKWITNNCDVLESIPEEERAKEAPTLDLNQAALPVQRALGVHWSTSDDTLGIKIQPKERACNRRGLLSIVSSVYDPLGFVCPVVLQAKKIFQAECKLKKSWDDDLEPKHEELWLQWLERLPLLQQLKWDRCMIPAGFGSPLKIELHHFSDASQEAYGTVSYLRVVNHDGRIHCCFVIAKSRLAPLKTLTIPRLELQAAVMAVKLDTKIQKELRVHINESIFWTDSMVVLQYIRNTSSRFKTFVANRLATIHNATAMNQWHYVDSKRNPADDASRGLSAQQMINRDRWRYGPDFLWKDEEEWPSPPEIASEELKDDSEVKQTLVTCTATAKETSEDPISELFRRFSCWFRLKKAVAWLQRFKLWLQKGKHDVPKGPIQVSEMKLAEVAILKFVQRETYQKELRDLDKGKQLSPQSHILALQPFRDEQGLLRVGGRLKSAPISEESKHPIILPPNHHVSMLVARYVHEWRVRHSGKEHVLAVLRGKFWIPRVRPIINRIIRCCIHCKRLRGSLGAQKMADLPVDRVTPYKAPFTYVGVDVFGPMMVKRGRCQEKKYGCLFTCLTTRAIHIEKLDSLDSSSFINALVRFAARRGDPDKMRSDNGTNFVGGLREIRESVQQWRESKNVQKHLLKKEIEWEFNPPSASHMGGIWERQIRTVRKCMDTLLRNQVLDDERLTTLFSEVESIVNSRPITHVSSDPFDPEPLTPNHLLLLRGGPDLVPGVYDKDDVYRKRWRHVQFMADTFWKRWIKEYLPSLQHRQKWNKQHRNLAEGDIVLVMDEQVPRKTWPLARVTKTFSGKDGLVRSAEVKTRWSVLTRPIHKLCYLEGV